MNFASLLHWSLLCVCLWAAPLHAQDTEKDKPSKSQATEAGDPASTGAGDPASTEAAEPTVTEPLVTGGVNYQPVRKSNEKLRDPFKSPFEIQKEEREQRRITGGLPDRENRLPYSLSQLELRGIYYHAGKGYRAIFRVGSEYKWWPAGTKFRDADLVDITDGAAIFKQYTSDDESQVRDVVRELHRGEE